MNQLARTAQEVVEQQSGAIAELMKLRQHRTVQTNRALSSAVDAAWQQLITANALSCVLWFPRDTHGDVEPFLPDAA